MEGRGHSGMFSSAPQIGTDGGIPCSKRRSSRSSPHSRRLSLVQRDKWRDCVLRVFVVAKLCRVGVLVRKQHGFNYNIHTYVTAL